MRWPIATTCHGTSARHLSPPAWRAPDVQPLRPPTKEDRLPDCMDYPFRTCGYCGSIHPEDLYNALSGPGAELVDCVRCGGTGTRGGRIGALAEAIGESLPCFHCDGKKQHVRVRLDMADWKYGFPHKFYVDGIPSGLVGHRVPRGGRYWTDENGVARQEAHWHDVKPGESAHAKWYNEHFQDEGFDDEAFRALAVEIWRRSKVAFRRDPDGRVKWQAGVAATDENLALFYPVAS